MINELIKASKECGGRLYTVAVELFFLIVHNTKVPPLDHFRYLLGELRHMLLHQINPPGKNSVHTYNKLMMEFGKEWAIPGHEAISAFEDPYANMPKDLLAGARTRFFSYYTAHRIIDATFNQLQGSQTSREAFEGWAKNKIKFPFNTTKEENEKAFADFFEQFMFIDENYALTINRDKVIELLIEIGAISSNETSSSDFKYNTIT